MPSNSTELLILPVAPSYHASPAEPPEQVPSSVLEPEPPMERVASSALLPELLRVVPWHSSMRYHMSGAPLLYSQFI